MNSKFRGHDITQSKNGEWIFASTGKSVKENYQSICCGHCGLPNTPEDHDGCIPSLPGAMNACCGHGEPETAYSKADGFFSELVRIHAPFQARMVVMINEDAHMGES